jgi:hypothetical protein
MGGFFLEMLTIHYVSVADIFIAKIDVMLGIRLRALIAFNVVKLFSFETDASFKLQVFFRNEIILTTKSII